MLVTAAIVFVLDLTFETLNKHGVNKIKEVVSANNTTSNQTTENTNNETSTENSQNTSNTESTDNNVEENVQ